MNKLTIELSINDNSRDKMFGISRDRFYEHFLVEHFKSDTREEFAKSLENRIKQELNPCDEVFSTKDINISIERWCHSCPYEWKPEYYTTTLYNIFNDNDDYHKFLAKLRKRGINITPLTREEKEDSLKRTYLELVNGG